MNLVTGGSGFIGSHIVDGLLANGEQVRVLDDLSTGRPENLEGSRADLVVADVSDFSACLEATEGIEVIFHEAAARAVGLSVTDPITSDRVNSGGTVNILTAARDNGVRRVIIASSSSVYGGVAPLPTPEDAPIHPKSPYAVSKAASEMYCRVFSELYGIETIVLRYFNVYGPRQHPKSPYAAAIPLFVNALLDGRRPTIFGDGLQSRDFTYVDDVVRANLAAAKVGNATGQIFNVAAGGERTIVDLVAMIQKILGTDLEPVFEEARAGDVRASRADPGKALSELGWEAQTDFEEGLARTIEWLKSAT